MINKGKGNLKISILGPVYPFKGGISHYNSELSNHLAKHAITQVISYSRAFPSWLYPGKSQMDYSSKNLFKGSAQFIFDTLNPLTWKKTASEIIKFKPGLLILHWYTTYFSIPFYFLLKNIKRKHDCRVLVICHNVLPHERRIFDEFLTKLVFKEVDDFVVHSDQDFKNLKRMIPNANVQKLFLPVFDVFYRKLDKLKTKEALGINGNLLLFFGLVRKYKGLDYLLNALPIVLDEIPVKLLIVGEFWESKQKYLNQINRLGLQDAVRIIDRYVSDDEVPLFFSAADVVVTPYTSGTQSGVINIAYAFNKPVITTDVGGLGEVVKDGKTGYVVKSCSSQELAKAVIEFYTKGKLGRFSSAIRQFKKRFSWNVLCQKIINKFY